jgi:hypothetical protein
LTGAIPKTIADLKRFGFEGIDLLFNLLTGNATMFVDRFGPEILEYNCFNPAVPPSNPSC